MDSILKSDGVLSLNFVASNLLQNVRINCKQLSSLNLYNITTVCISKLEFVGCGGNRVELVGRLSIEDTRFQGQRNSSRALELVTTTAVIERSDFTSNMAGSFNGMGRGLWKKRARVKNLGGGAITMTHSSIITVIDSTFAGNSANAGGAIFGEQLSYIVVINSTFMGNHAFNKKSCYGGALYIQSGSTLEIYNSTFKNNIAISETRFNGAGGSIAIAGGAAYLHISGSEFSYNNAMNGGAIAMIMIYDNPSLSRRDINLLRRTASNIDRNRLSNYNRAHDHRVIRARGNNDNVINIIGSKLNNNSADEIGGALWIENSIVNIHMSKFSYNRAGNSQGGVMHIQEVTLNIKLGWFHHNRANDGGVIFAERCSLNINESHFVNNEANISGGAISVIKCSLNINKSHFINNEVAHFSGGAIYALTVHTMDISGCEFDSNVGDLAGAVAIEAVIEVNIIGSTFSNNVANVIGGAIYIYDCLFAVSIRESVFSNNEAKSGGVIYVRGSLIIISKSEVSNNMCKTGILQTFESKVLFTDNVSFFSNVGSLFLFSSDLTIAETSHITFTNNSSPPQKSKGTSGTQQGGAITAFQSNITLYGICTLTDNHAHNGGAIHASQSKVFVHGDILVANNRATHSGGGVYLYQSELHCKEHSTLNLLTNSATKTGGGIHATSSLILVDHIYYNGEEQHKYYVNFTANNAEQGGGLCLEVNAKVYILKRFVKIETSEVRSANLLLFSTNSANYGGAMYVADDTNSAMCASTSYTMHSAPTECSIQTLALHGELYNELIRGDILFIENYAYYSGSTLFGGLLDRCTVSPFAEVYSFISLIQFGSDAIIDGVTYFKVISTITEPSTIGSQPVRVCFCRDSRPDCTLQSLNIQVMKAEIFEVPLVAVDQVNRIVNATIYSSLSSNYGGLGEDQSSQNTTESCSDLNFSVFSPHKFEILILYANGPCKDAELSKVQVSIKFLPCHCPVGFQPNTMETTKCMCECDSKIHHYITECYQHNRTLVREGTFWITYLNSTTNSIDYTYLIYPYCPLDYCHSPTKRVYINLSIEGGSNEQCNFNRSGILCGSCYSGFSLSLGSSHCIQCPTYWPLLCAIILTVAFLAGIALVAVILFLNVTVATGVLNGIILYANIINANRTTFFPFSEPNFITVFIAWLNLELGIDTCLFEGMDTYWKTMLQLAFPIYVIVLVVVVILISERSTKFARLIGRKNPVATLATLILLSYAKLLQTIIAALSFSILDYPDGSREVVWLPDGTISYLSGKHILLFFTAVIILLAGVAYTALLFFWQWLIYYQDKKVFRWVRYHRLYLFLEPYHAPYVFKHRYWTGLLLLLRVILYMASALNVSRAPGVDLLVTGIIIISLLLLKGYVGIHGCVYRKWPVDVLETTCYVNIMFLTLVSFYTLEANKNQTVAAYISGTITLFLLLIVLAYHILIETCPKTMLLNKLRVKILPYTKEDGARLLDYQPADSDLREPHQPTVSWMDAPPREEQPLSALVKAGESEKESDKETPLLMNLT